LCDLFPQIVSEGSRKLDAPVLLKPRRFRGFFYSSKRGYRRRYKPGSRPGIRRPRKLSATSFEAVTVRPAGSVKVEIVGRLGLRPCSARTSIQTAFVLSVLLMVPGILGKRRIADEPKKPAVDVSSMPSE
jgi:hypothetical protein